MRARFGTPCHQPRCLASIHLIVFFDAATGTHHAMRATQRRHELSAQPLYDDGSGYLQGNVVQEACVPASHVVDASAAVEVSSLPDSNPAFLHVSSGVSVEGELCAEDLALRLKCKHPDTAGQVSLVPSATSAEMWTGGDRHATREIDCARRRHKRLSWSRVKSALCVQGVVQGVD